VQILAAAIRNVGLNRERIRQALISMKPYDGAGGRIRWDTVGQNARPVTAASY
jgi:ABC-type branched-subunit amino acid transport system substrate-binding protein